MRILVIEDDPVLADGVRTGLALRGATLDVVASCAEGKAALEANEFDAVVLDIMLPDGSGLDLLASLRIQGNRVPVLLLTALDEVADRIAGLDRGADDYLGKPFDLDELAARVRAISRRREDRASPFVSQNGIMLDLARLTATVDGAAVTLSRREFAILAALMARPGVVLSKSDLEARLYGWQEEVESNTVEVHVHNLRAKIGRAKIETVRGIGYRMRTAQP